MKTWNLPVFTLLARLSRYTGSGTLRETAEPLKLLCAGNHAPPTVPACVVLVACPESNASHGDRSAALHVLILFYLIQREIPASPRLLVLSPSPKFCMRCNCRLQDPQYCLFQQAYELVISFQKISSYYYY